MIAVKKIKRTIVAVAGGTALAFGFAVAGLLGLALVLIPAGLAILSLESQRAKRWLRKSPEFLPNPTTTGRSETCPQKDS